MPFFFFLTSYTKTSCIASQIVAGSRQYITAGTTMVSALFALPYPIYLSSSSQHDGGGKGGLSASESLCTEWTLEEWVQLLQLQAFTRSSPRCGLADDSGRSEHGTDIVKVTYVTWSVRSLTEFCNVAWRRVRFTCFMSIGCVSRG